MEFALTDEQTAMVDTARQFAGDRLAPGYAAREKTGEVEPEVWREMGQLGLIATELPEDVGGIGCDTVTAGLLQEAMSTGDVNVALLALLASLNGQIVYHNALPEVAAHWLPPLIGGEIMLALALTEPGSGSDAAQLRLQAWRDGADFILNGEKPRSRRPTRLTRPWSSRAPTPTPARAASQPSWSTSTAPASVVPVSTMSACARSVVARCFSTMCGCRRLIFWAGRTKVSARSCPVSIIAAP